MSRRRRAEKREISPDPVYNSLTVAKFINRLMYDGKKSVARRIVYNAIERFGKKVNSENFLEVFEQAKPQLEVKSRRVGGATYQVPVEIPASRKTSMAMKWIIQYAREKAGRSMEEGLALELHDCFMNQGSTIKKKDDTHRMAEANRAFAFFKW